MPERRLRGPGVRIAQPGHRQFGSQFDGVGPVAVIGHRRLHSIRERLWSSACFHKRRIGDAARQPLDRGRRVEDRPIGHHQPTAGGSIVRAALDRRPPGVGPGRACEAAVRHRRDECSVATGRTTPCRRLGEGLRPRMPDLVRQRTARSRLGIRSEPLRSVTRGVRCGRTRSTHPSRPGEVGALQAWSDVLAFEGLRGADRNRS